MVILYMIKQLLYAALLICIFKYINICDKTNLHYLFKKYNLYKIYNWFILVVLIILYLVFKNLFFLLPILLLLYNIAYHIINKNVNELHVPQNIFHINYDNNENSQGWSLLDGILIGIFGSILFIKT